MAYFTEFINRTGIVGLEDKQLMFSIVKGLQQWRDAADTNLRGGRRKTSPAG